MGLVVQVLAQEIERPLSSPSSAGSTCNLLASLCHVGQPTMTLKKINDVIKHVLKNPVQILSLAQRLFSCSMQSKILLT